MRAEPAQYYPNIQSKGLEYLGRWCIHDYERSNFLRASLCIYMSVWRVILDHPHPAVKILSLTFVAKSLP